MPRLHRSFPRRALLLLAFSLLLLLAYQLRVYRLGDLNFNWDEGYSGWIVRLPLADLLETTARDVHPPAYYLVLRLQRGAAGGSEFAMRYPSLLFGLLTTALAAALGRAVGGWRVGLLAALLLAVSRANIEIAQLARMHMLAGAFSVGGLWMTVLWLRQTRPPRWGVEAAYVVCVAGALYTFYLAAMLPLATNLAFVFVWLRRGRPSGLLLRWVLLQAAAALLFLPWAGYALPRMHGWNAEQATAFGFFIQVYFVTLTIGISAYWEAYRPLVGAVVAAFVVGLGAIVDHARRAPAALGRDQRDGLTLLIAALLMPILVVFLLTLPIHQLGRPLATRYLLMLSGGFYVLAAWGAVAFSRAAAPGRVRAARRRLHRVAGVVYLGVVVGAALVGTSSAHENRLLRDTWVSVVDTLHAHRQGQDGMVLHNDRAWTTLDAAYPDGDWLDIPKDADITADFAAYLLAPLWERSEGVWLLKTAEALVNDPQDAVETWLRTRAVASERWTFTDSTLTFYARTDARAGTVRSLAPGYAAPLWPEAERQGGLAGAWLPLREYAVGDSVQLALYWDAPPQEITLRLDAVAGATPAHTVTFAPVSAAPGALTRQVVALPLTPDLPVGDYRLRVTAPGQVTLGTFTLRRLATAPPAGATEAQFPLTARFGESIEVLGYSLGESRLRPGEPVEVTLFWRATALLPERYKVSVFVLGAAFNPATNTPLWGQQDAEPLEWTLPTTLWPPGVVLADPYRFVLDAATPPGDYTLGVALYGVLDGVRLPVYAGGAFAPAGDYLPLRTFDVPAPAR